MRTDIVGFLRRPWSPVSMSRSIIGNFVPPPTWWAAAIAGTALTFTIREVPWSTEILAILFVLCAAAFAGLMAASWFTERASTRDYVRSRRVGLLSRSTGLWLLGWHFAVATVLLAGWLAAQQIFGATTVGLFLSLLASITLVYVAVGLSSARWTARAALVALMPPLLSQPGWQYSALSTRTDLREKEARDRALRLQPTLAVPILTALDDLGASNAGQLPSLAQRPGLSWSGEPIVRLIGLGTPVAAAIPLAMIVALAFSSDWNMDELGERLGLPPVTSAARSPQPQETKELGGQNDRPHANQGDSSQGHNETGQGGSSQAPRQANQSGSSQGQNQSGQGGNPQSSQQASQGGGARGQNQSGQGGSPQSQGQSGQSGSSQGQNQAGQGGNPQSSQQANQGSGSGGQNQSGQSGSPQSQGQSGQSGSSQGQNQAGQSGNPQPSQQASQGSGSGGQNQSGQSGSPQSQGQSGQSGSSQGQNQAGQSGNPQSSQQANQSSNAQGQNQSSQGNSAPGQSQSSLGSSPQSPQQTNQGSGTQSQNQPSQGSSPQLSQQANQGRSSQGQSQSGQRSDAQGQSQPGLGSDPQLPQQANQGGGSPSQSRPGERSDPRGQQGQSAQANSQDRRGGQIRRVQETKDKVDGTETIKVGGRGSPANGESDLILESAPEAMPPSSENGSAIVIQQTQDLLAKRGSGFSEPALTLSLTPDRKQAQATRPFEPRQHLPEWVERLLASPNR
ncbi:MAG: hypothetical protein LCH93_06025 [Proteobacteria bacterium]|nr:hypothetical protein [Pseudomonadota bacterium]